MSALLCYLCCMESIRINIDDYVRSGEGANGASYFHKADPDKMVKMMNSSFPLEIIEDELSQSVLAYESGIPCPEPGRLVVDQNGCYGIQFKRIRDKISFSRAIGNEPDRVEEYARKFARMSLKLHSTVLDKSKCKSARQIDLDMLEESPYFYPEEKKKFRDFILSVPDADTAVHGDLQFSNTLMSSEGDFFIDLGGFSYGHPYFDLGQVLLCCCYSPDEFIREVFHMEPETSKEFWKYFVLEYFGEDSDLDTVTEMIKPYSALMTILIDRNTGTRNEIFHKLMG